MNSLSRIRRFCFCAVESGFLEIWSHSSFYCGAANRTKYVLGRPLAFERISFHSVVFLRTVSFRDEPCFESIRALRSLIFEVCGAGCFRHCCSLESLVFEGWSKLQYIEKDIFADTLLREVRLPNSIRFIRSRAFPHLLRSVLFYPFSTTSASGSALISHLGRAMSLVIPQSVETIGDGCFQGNETLESLAFESNSISREIGEVAFASAKAKGQSCFRGVSEWSLTGAATAANRLK
jgi:hypothetical protein